MRAAAAGGARHVAFDRKATWKSSWLLIRFDGEPLTTGEHESPFDAVFSEVPGPRPRLLAGALLTLCRRTLGPVEVTSGHGAARRTVRIVIDGDDEFLEAREPGKDTVIRVETSELLDAALMRVDEHCALLRPKLTKGSWTLPRFNPRGPGLWFEEAGARGWIAPPPFIGGEWSRLRLFNFGVSAGVKTEGLRTAQVEAWINDDQAELDLSGNVVSGPRYERLRELVERQVERLALKLARGQAKRLARAWARIKRDLLARDCWKRRAEWGPHRVPDGLTFGEGLFSLVSSRARRQGLVEVLWAAHVTAWLREIAERLLARPDRRDAPKPLLEALSRAPLFIDKWGEGASYLQLSSELDRAGRLWFSSARERKALERLFPRGS